MQGLCRVSCPLPPVEDDAGEEEGEGEDHAAQQRHKPRLGDQVARAAAVRVAAKEVEL